MKSTNKKFYQKNTPNLDQKVNPQLNLCQKVCKFGQNLNHDIMTYLIKYTLTVQFSI